MIERMTLLLDLFDAATPRLTLAELAERSGLPRSTTHRILDQLVALRWLDHSGQSYVLGMRALELGGLAVAHHELREVAAPLLADLHQRTGAVATLAVLDRKRRRLRRPARARAVLRRRHARRRAGTGARHRRRQGDARLARRRRPARGVAAAPRHPDPPDHHEARGPAARPRPGARPAAASPSTARRASQGTSSVAVALRGTRQGARGRCSWPGTPAPSASSASRRTSRRPPARPPGCCSPSRASGGGRAPSTASRWQRLAGREPSTSVLEGIGGDYWI